MAMRGVYEWMFGIKPTLDGLEISPCLPGNMKTVEAQFEYLGKKHILIIDGENIFIDEKPIITKRNNLITGKEVFFATL